MPSEVIKVEITQKKIDDLKKAGITTIVTSKLVNNYDSSKYYIPVIIEDIEIPSGITFSINNIIVENHTITNYGTINYCSTWYIISSSIINYGIFDECSYLYIMYSSITNYRTFNDSSYWFIMYSSITNNGTIEDCISWILIYSSSTVILSTWYVHGYLQDTNTDNSNTIDNTTNNNKDEKLSKLLLLLLLNKSDNDLTHNINRLVKQ